MDVTTVRSVVLTAREHGITLVAAGLAFYMFNSLLALLVFFVVITTTIGWVDAILVAIEPVLWTDPDTVLSEMEDLIGEGVGRRRALILAGVILVWSSFTMFQSVNIAFGHIYDSRASRSYLGTVLDTLLVLVTVILAVGVMLVLHLGLSVLTGPTVATVVSIPLVGLGLFGTFLPIFSQFSPPAIGSRDVLPGVVLAAVSWTACAVGFRLYITTAESVDLYGVAGAVMLLLTVLYLGALTLLVGVVLNAELAGEHSSVQES